MISIGSSLSRIASVCSLVLLFSSAARAEPVCVAGTRVFLQPPPEFVPATEFQGFAMPDLGATIVVREIPQSFDEYREHFSHEAIEGRGLSVREHGRLRIDSFEGLLVRATDASAEIPYEAWMLIFGNLQGSVMIVASYPEANAFEFRTGVHDALVSAEWQPTTEIPDFEGLGFEVEESKRLKISTRFPDALVLTEDGRGRSGSDSPILVISRSSGRFDFGNLEEFSRQQLEATEVVKELTAIEGTLKSVAGMPGYEITAKGTEARTRAPLHIYQLVLGERGRVYIIQGFVGPSRAREFVPEFRAVAESLQPE